VNRIPLTTKGPPGESGPFVRGWRMGVGQAASAAAGIIG
jgi:hypothetical protein